MKLLLDENISHRLLHLLSDTFQPSTHSRIVSPIFKSDKDIWNYAKKHRYVIVTFDGDFNEWQMLNGFPPKIIWLRCGNISSKGLAHKLNSHEKQLVNFLRNKREGIIEIF